MENNVVIEDSTQFHITPETYVYPTGPLKEFTLEMMFGKRTGNGYIYLKDDTIYNVLAIDYMQSIVNFNNLYTMSSMQNDVPHYFCITYDGNTLVIYYIETRRSDLKKENMIQVYSKGMKLSPSKIVFKAYNTSTTDIECYIPFQLFRVSNKFNDIYYVK